MEAGKGGMSDNKFHPYAQSAQEVPVDERFSSENTKGLEEETQPVSSFVSLSVCGFVSSSVCHFVAFLVCSFVSFVVVSFVVLSICRFSVSRA